jgi:hypothetical protein
LADLSFNCSKRITIITADARMFKAAFEYLGVCVKIEQLLAVFKAGENKEINDYKQKL